MTRLRKALWLMFPFGFASGLPYALSGGTLQAWLTTAHIDIKTIGAFSLVALPYSLKFLWSPLMDSFSIPFLGRRRGWIIVCQLILASCCIAMALLDPGSHISLVAFLAIGLAFFSASQDIVIDAYRTDILDEKERGLGVGLTVTGYRMAMLVSGALALVMADFFGWRSTYFLMAAIMAGMTFFTLIADEPETRFKQPRSFTEAVKRPLDDLLSRHSIKVFLLLIILYKVGDAFAGSLSTAFLLRGVNFSMAEVGMVNKAFGLVATIVGSMVAGGLMTRWSLYKSLFFFGILQAVSNLTFMVLALVGKSLPLMVVAVGFENLSGGMGTAAFVALLMALCNPCFSATQYAVLSALASVGRVVIGPAAGFLVDSLGWTKFFFVTFLFALPGLFLVYLLKRPLLSLERESHDPID